MQNKTKKSHGPSYTRRKLVSSPFTLRYSYPQIELSSEITKNSQETIQNAVIFSKLFLVMDNLFEHLQNFQKDI